MKTLFLILTILIASNANSQNDYKLYSKVWKLVPTIYGGYDFEPVGDSYYDFQRIDSVRNNINPSKVNSYLLKSFNEFRKDYGAPPVIEDLSLSSRCQSFSKILPTNFSHDNTLKDAAECIGTLHLISLTKISKTDGDFNKIVADCLFDKFVNSKPHMDILLDKYPKYGFGYTIINNKIYVVIRGKY
jgi:hypothetical protein